MTSETFHFLLHKKSREGLSPDEQSALDAWLAAPENAHAANELTAILEAADRLPAPAVDETAELARLKKRLRAEAERPALEVVHRRSPARWAWAMAASLALGLAAFFFFQKTGKGQAEEVLFAAQNIDNQRVALPDGSVAWLRKGSEIRFAKHFDGQKERRARLVGEAFFEVEKDAAKPFLVESEGCETRVLGTSFNVRARSGEPTVEVEVRTGRVRFSEKKNGGSAELSAGEKAVFERERGKIETSETPIEAVADWRSDDFLAKNELLASAIERLERRFSVKIELEKSALATTCRWSVFLPKASLADALANLEAVFGLRAVRNSDGNWRLVGGRCAD